MSRLRHLLLIAIATAGCDSQLHLGASPSRPALEAADGVDAILAAGPAGQTVTIDDPTRLPAAVQSASDLSVAFGGVKVPVTRTTGGYYTFTIPANARVQQDVAGNLKVIIVMNDRDSQIITLRTGSPVAFSQPPVLTEPANALITRGLDITLVANTAASAEAYQFNWAYSTSGMGPWQTIPGTGKRIEWTPPAAGNFFVKVDAVDRATRQSYATVTPSAVVFVTDADKVVSTTPTSGGITRGSEVTLHFNRPAGLTGTHLSYAWSAGAGPQGPWQAISGNSERVGWLPTSVGNSYVKVEVSNRDTGDVNTFITPEAVVIVSEGTPIVTPGTQTLERGGKTPLTLNIPSAPDGPFSWYYGLSGSALPSWTLMPGNGKTVDFIANQAGSYHFRVDIPQSGGGVKSFTTTEPVLNVVETQPLIQTVPANQIIKPGGSVELKLNASGVNPAEFKFFYYVSTNPAIGWTVLPLDSVDDLYKTSRVWKTSAGQPTGQYFVRVDAQKREGTDTYTFTSNTPVVTIQQ